MRVFIINILLFTSLLFAGGLQDIDDSIYRSVHDGWHSDFADKYFCTANALGGGEFYLGANLALMCFGDSKMRDSSKLSSVTVATSIATVMLLKCAVGRPRPEDANPPRWDSSFPSGHTAAAFAMAYIYGEQYPRLRIPLYLFATSVGLSRIYLGEHYPSDVLTGAAIGVASGIIIEKNKNFVLSIGL